MAGTLDAGTGATGAGTTAAGATAAGGGVGAMTAGAGAAGGGVTRDAGARGVAGTRGATVDGRAPTPSVAFVTFKEGQMAAADELKDHCRKEGLPQWKVPRDVHVVDDLPRSPTGKVLKRELAAKVNRAGA